MARSGAAIHEHGADGRLERITDGKAAETVPVDELIPGLLGEHGLGIGIHDIGGEEGLFHVAPATPYGVLPGAGFGNLRGMDHPGIIMNAVRLGAEQAEHAGGRGLGGAPVIERGRKGGIGNRIHGL